MRFDWPGAVSEQSDFQLSGADSVNICIKLPLPEIGISNTKIKFTPEALALIEKHQTLKPTKTTAMAPSNNFHRGDYIDSKTIDLVGLPAHIKCFRCHKFKSPFSYAATRQKDLKVKIHNDSKFNAHKDAYIVCISCTGSQVTELTCNTCDKTKWLGSFSKAQRRHPDKAECWKCLQERLNTEPGADSDSGNNSRSGSDDEEDSDESECGGGSTVAGTFSNLSVTNGSTTAGGVSLNSPTGTGALNSYVSSSAGNSSGGVKAASSVASSTATNRKSVDTNNGLPRGFNPNGYGLPPHLRARGPASVASTTSSSGNAKFAKVKAGPRKIFMDTAARERQREMDEEEDDKEVESSESDSD